MKSVFCVIILSTMLAAAAFAGGGEFSPEQRALPQTTIVLDGGEKGFPWKEVITAAGAVVAAIGAAYVGAGYSRKGK